MKTYETNEAEKDLYNFCHTNNGLQILERELTALRRVIKNNETGDMALTLTLDTAEKHLLEAIACISLCYKRAKELNI